MSNKKSNIKYAIFFLVFAVMIAGVLGAITYIAPIYPPDDSWTNINTTTFNFTVYSDTLSEGLNCTLYLNGDSNNNFTADNGSNSVTVDSELNDGSYAWVITCTDDGLIYNSTSGRTINIDTVPPMTEIYGASINNQESGNFGGGDSILMGGYANDTASGLKNWSLDLYENGAWDSTICDGTNSFNDSEEESFCDWDSTTFCPIGNVCENLALVLSAYDNAGNWYDGSNDSARISQLTIDNEYPVIEEDAAINYYSEEGGNQYWTIRFNASDSYLSEVDATVVDSDNYTVVSWIFVCNESQGGTCDAPGSGNFNMTWHTEIVSLDGTNIYPVIYRFNFEPVYGSSDDWYFDTLPGCLKIDSGSEYDCGQETDVCAGPNPDDCVKAYRWYLVFNVSGETGTFMGFTQENNCAEGGGCTINYTSIVSGQTKFKPQKDKYVGQNTWEHYNFTEITLYSIGNPLNPEHGFIQKDGDYGWFVQAFDYVWASDALWANSMTMDSSFPEIHFQFWNTSSWNETTQQNDPYILPDFHSFTKGADIFIGPTELTIEFAVNATDNDNVTSVIASLLEFNDTNGFAYGKRGTCGGELELELNATSRLWEGSCTLEAFTSEDLANYNSDIGRGGNVASFNIQFTAYDSMGNPSSALYNTSSDLSDPAVCPDGNYAECLPAFTVVNLEDFGVPEMGSNPCVRFGSLTTNFSTEDDFTDINFINEVEMNLSCQYDPSLPSNFTRVMLLNFSSLDFSSPAMGQKLSELPNKITFEPLLPHTFGESRIYVNTSFFAELDKNTTIIISHLPFISKPEIIADENPGAIVSSSWVTNGLEEAFGVVTGNLTFRVTGFSGYNVTDNDTPIVNITSPVDGAEITGGNITINVTANGTGSEISEVVISFDGVDYSWVEDGDFNCTQVGTSEIFTCSFTTTIHSGEYDIVATAYDYGGASPGNHANDSISVTVNDTEAPVVSGASPSGEISYTTSTTLSVTTDENATCRYNQDVDANFTNMTAMTDAATTHTKSITVAGSTSYIYYVRCKDWANNTNNVSTEISFSVKKKTTGSSPGGGGPGGGSTVTSNPSTSQTWTRVNPGGTQIMKVVTDDFGIKEISMTVINPANNVKIEIEKLPGQPASITKNITGKVFKYLKITKTNLNDSNINGVIMVKFQVTRSWLTANGIEAAQIVLKRFLNDSATWTDLKTSLKSTDDKFAYYEAETPGFSYFAIAQASTVVPSAPMPKLPEAPATQPPAELGDVQPSGQEPPSTGGLPGENPSVDESTKKAQIEWKTLLTMAAIIVVIGLIVVWISKGGKLPKMPKIFHKSYRFKTLEDE